MDRMNHTALENDVATLEALLAEGASPDAHDKAGFTPLHFAAQEYAVAAADASGELRDVPPGSYRLRVSAKARDAGEDGEFSEEVIDYYLLEMWPASQPDAILRSSSKGAEYWHKTNGSRR